MLSLWGVNPVRGSLSRYTAGPGASLIQNCISKNSQKRSGALLAAGTKELRAWLWFECCSFSSVAATRATSNVASAAPACGPPCSPSPGAQSPATTAAATGAATGSLSPSAAAALGVIRSAYERICKKSVSLNIHVHHQAIKTQVPKPKAAAATAARLTAAASRAAAAPVAPAASAGAGTGTAAPRRNVKQLTRAERRSFEGHVRRFQLMGDKSEFHHVDRNKNQRIFEPYHMFSLSITTSKNNVHCVVRNSSSNKRTVFASFAGNVGIRKSAQQSNACALRIGENIARKLRRLGVEGVSVEFRRISRVSAVLKALSNHKIHVYSITHKPRLPTCGLNARKARKRRRV